MPRSRSDIPDVMEPTGRTDQHKGSQYRCSRCGGLRWTVWGAAWDHYPDYCPEADDE